MFIELVAGGEVGAVRASVVQVEEAVCSLGVVVRTKSHLFVGRPDRGGEA
jgi:hypothetical protein